MYARSNSITAQLAAINRGIAYLREEIMPEVLGTEGCVGLSMLVNRDSGRCIATTAWRSAESMHASEEDIRPIRERYAATFGGTDLVVNEWEIAVMHRDHRSPDGACSRTSWLRVEPSATDQMIESVKTIMPDLEALAGFCSASLLVDRESGTCVSSIAYDSSDAMTEAREGGKALRARVAREAGAEILDVAEFELVLAHLRVPELV